MNTCWRREARLAADGPSGSIHDDESRAARTKSNRRIFGVEMGPTPRRAGRTLSHTTGGSQEGGR
jgi:hypothetical protein